MIKLKTHIFYFPFLLMLIISCSGASYHGEDHDDHGDHEDHEETHEHGKGDIVIEPDQALKFGITTDTVKASVFNDVIKTAGSIEPSAEDVMRATAKRSGIVTLKPGISTGSSVKTGEVLATISKEGIEGGDRGKADIVNLEAARKEYMRLKPLYEEGLVTASVFLEAERVYHEAEAIAGKGKGAGGSTVVVSPCDGVISSLNVRSGELVDVGGIVATIARNTTQILKADLPIREAKHLGEISTANFISEGSKELVKLKERGGRKITGANGTSTENGYIPIYFSFTGNSQALPGGFVEVFLICGEREGVISLPREGLIEIQGNKYVYVKSGDHSYEKRLVKTGAADGDRIEITEGLEEGEIAVVKGASVVRMAEVSAIAPPAHTHNH